MPALLLASFLITSTCSFSFISPSTPLKGFKVLVKEKATSAAPLSLTKLTKLQRQSKRSLLDTRLDAIWSNEQAVQDYRDFLDNKPSTTDWKPDQPSCFVFVTAPNADPDAKRNPQEELLEQMVGGEDEVLRVTIDEDLVFPKEVNGNEEYPIYIACDPDLLPSFAGSAPVQALRKMYPPSPKLEDFVFFHHSGRISESLLRSNNLGSSDQTSALLNLGLKPAMSGGLRSHTFINGEISLGVDAMGQKKIAGKSITCGKWAGSTKSRIETTVKRTAAIDEGDNWSVVDLGFYRDVRRVIFEYGIMCSAFNLIGSVHSQTSKEELTYSTVALGYGDECVEMVRELSGCLRGSLAVTMMFGFEERIMEIAERGELWKMKIASIEDAGWDTTNGWWLNEMSLAQLEKAKKARIPLPDPLEMHSEYLGFIGKNIEVFDESTWDGKERKQGENWSTSGTSKDYGKFTPNNGVPW
ncbi:hypothetical protein TrST_g3227 [Triparma strigata]|uniref:Uncharacterized protein n=1 Tax=Triparma strigata TaxID=1606541 RepID=A0A9W7AAK3_9STRA|nr:hypothetical protein TrST_g3227 [Triparma strigata]